jgi:hypothetical protein
MLVNSMLLLQKHANKWHAYYYNDLTHMLLRRKHYARNEFVSLVPWN